MTNSMSTLNDRGRSRTAFAFLVQRRSEYADALAIRFNEITTNRGDVEGSIQHAMGLAFNDLRRVANEGSMSIGPSLDYALSGLRVSAKTVKICRNMMLGKEKLVLRVMMMTTEELMNQPWHVDVSRELCNTVLKDKIVDVWKKVFRFEIDTATTNSPAASSARRGR